MDTTYMEYNDLFIVSVLTFMASLYLHLNNYIRVYPGNRCSNYSNPSTNAWSETLVLEFFPHFFLSTYIPIISCSFFFSPFLCSSSVFRTI
ncbi:hypothetical protein BDB01DRAFT_390788 [Pilobolus umbonatus]|nr:hypothetical protein BDB01DRAFT_390788 [Pilobolus umbonatus]